MNRIINILKHLIIKLLYSSKTRVFSEKGSRLEYFFKKGKTKNLIVVFSAFTSHYIEGRFNYVQTLKHNSDNQLYIKDNEGFFKNGTYYLGNHMNIYKNNLVTKLISFIKEKHKLDYVITIGSSKGGTCSILYGLLAKADHIVCASPQYRFGSYLNSWVDESDPDYGKKMINAIIGGTDFSISNLDEFIEQQLSFVDSINISLVYSTTEPSWKREVCDLFAILKSKKGNHHFIKQDFDEHGAVGAVFKKSVLSLIEQAKQ